MQEPILLMCILAFVFGALTRGALYLSSIDKNEFSWYEFLAKYALEGGIVGLLGVVFMITSFEFRAPKLQSILLGSLAGFLGFDFVYQLAMQTFNVKKNQIKGLIRRGLTDDATDEEAISKKMKKLEKRLDELKKQQKDE